MIGFIGLILVTDAISALGLEPGHYRLGDQDVEVTHSSAVLAGTETLCGAIATQDRCIRNFKRSAGTSRKFVLLFVS